MPIHNILLLLSLSMNACYAHYLGDDLIKKDASTERTVSAVQELKNDGGSNFIVSLEVKAHLKEDETAIQTSGDDRVVVDMQKGVQEAVKIEVWKRQFGRSMLGSSSTPHETKKPVDSKQPRDDDESVERVDVMDYAQPHYKPPIHN